jgi:hypothetical protein
MHVQQSRLSRVVVDVESLQSLDNNCNGCADGGKCCCASFEVCVTTAELKRIIRVLPEAVKYCPHLLTTRGYDNVFDEEEPGLYSIETTEDGLCLFAYRTNHRIRCSLHTAALKLGLPLEQVKPKACLLWPIHFSDGNEVLAITEDAFLFPCNARKAPDSCKLSPGFAGAIELVYGEGCGERVKRAAEKGVRRTRI